MWMYARSERHDLIFSTIQVKVGMGPVSLMSTASTALNLVKRVGSDSM
jgi:hypothetical protein